MTLYRNEFEIVSALGGGYLVLVGGVQWGKGPRDLSGCSSETFKTIAAAKRAIDDRESDVPLNWPDGTRRREET